MLSLMHLSYEPVSQAAELHPRSILTHYVTWTQDFTRLQSSICTREPQQRELMRLLQIWSDVVGACRFSL